MKPMVQRMIPAISRPVPKAGFPQNPTGFLTCPDPKHLEDPEAEKGPKFISLVVKPIVFARFQYAEQQKSRESGAPYHHEKGDYDLTRIVGAREGKRDDR
ncbi:MAG: hypothetical protein LQ340_002119 [Diploschistes diacapsis]|nr:MAG: hypothetical protein LQ340_002119 [Diploschistes diacapsis]